MRKEMSNSGTAERCSLDFPDNYKSTGWVEIFYDGTIMDRRQNEAE